MELTGGMLRAPGGANYNDAIIKTAERKQLFLLKEALLKKNVFFRALPE